MLIAGDSGSIFLSVIPTDVLSGRRVCPNTPVNFTCIANRITVLRWLRNGTEIEDFTSRDNAPIQRQLGSFTVYLNSSTMASDGTLNVTSTLVGYTGSGFQSGDRIECLDATGETRVLNFTLTCESIGQVSFICN